MTDLKHALQFPTDHRAKILGHCALCGGQVAAVVRAHKPTGLCHCGKPWAWFDGDAVEYADDASVPGA